MLSFYLSQDFQLSINDPSESTDGFKMEVHSEILSKYNQVIACVCFDKKQTKQVPLSFMGPISQEIYISDIYEYELSKSIEVYCMGCDNTPPYGYISSNTVEIEIPPKKDAILIPGFFKKNGIYNASADNADGYSIVTINVPDKSEGILNSLINRSIATITSNITYIGTTAFANCRALAEINFPKVKSIGESAFLGCSNLTKVNFPKVTYIVDSAFLGCSNLTEINFPEVISIGINAFNGCTALTKADFPKVTGIGNYAFNGCAALTKADFPKVTWIGNYAFSNCRSIRYFDMSEVAKVPTISNNTFNGTTCIFLFRDQTQLNEYAKATNWSALANRFQIKGATT